MKLGKEIERKFLLNKLPEGLWDGIDFQQGYLSVENPEVRLRIIRKGKKEKFFLTCKKGEGFVYLEEEEQISKSVFEILWPLTINFRIRKTRQD